MFLLVALTLVGGVLILVGAWHGDMPRVGVACLVPLTFLLIPLLQSVPLPAGLHRVIDPEGTALLADNPLTPGIAAPLSLDPPSTRVQIGRAAAGLIMFLVAFHLASGQRWRHVFPRLIATAGVAAVVIGLGHRVFGVTRIYGIFSNGNARGLLSGPFVNNNHTAAFLELATFVCLACSYQRANALNRIGWLTGAFFCAAGALGTLSRGAALGLGMGCLLFFFLRVVGDRAAGARFRRTSLLWGLFGIAVAVSVAAFLGAGQLLDRFHDTAFSSDVRFTLWRDSLRVLAAHPFGIGRGAFDRVFPVYKTMHTPFPLRFAFVENQPLQLLIDCGWLPFAALTAGMGVLVWLVARFGRRDAIEGALLAGLFAVLAHSFFDFGLETMGVLLPFLAVLGLTLGRSDNIIGSLLPGRIYRPIFGIVGVAAVIGAASIAHGSNDNFDASVKTATSITQRRAVLERAMQAHPTDYYYVLAYAGTVPLRPSNGGISPRLHVLNRALQLCPSCEMVHTAVARNLWQLGRRSQALVEWRAALDIQPSYFQPIIAELFAAGARPEELAAVASTNPVHMVAVANFLASISRADAAFAVLDQADVMGAPRGESLLVRARLQMLNGQLAAAGTTLAEAHAAAVLDPRLVLLDAELAIRNNAKGGPDAALKLLDEGAMRYPMDLAIQRMRIEIVLKYSKWQAADRAIEGLKLASYNVDGTAGEAHLMAARIQSRLSRWNNALGEYRMALATSPGDVNLWIEFSRAAEKAGRDATAREALSEAAHIAPGDPGIAADLRRIDQRQALVRGTASSTASENPVSGY